MRRFICLLLMTGVFAATSFAQVSIGGGYVNQSLSEHNPHLLHGIYIGGSYSILLWKKLSLTPGLYFLHTQGSLKDTGNLWLSWTFQTSIPIRDEKEQFKNNTLSLPVRVSYPIVTQPAFKLNISGGPSFSYELNTLYEYSCSEQYASIREKDLISSPLKIAYSRWSLGVIGGIDIELFNHFRISTWYEYGLNDRLKGYEYQTLQDDKSMHTQRLYAGIEYAF